MLLLIQLVTTLSSLLYFVECGFNYQVVKMNQKSHSESCVLYDRGQWNGERNCGEGCNEFERDCIHFLNLAGKCAVCVRNHESSGMTEIQEEPSYSQIIYEKMNIYDECVSNPCVSGVCVDRESSYFCQCPGGKYGANCQFIDECASNPCIHGTCVDQQDGYECACESGYVGQHCEQVFHDCAELYLSGVPVSGVYFIKPSAYGGSTFEVYCDMNNRGGGWTLFHKRYDGSENFTRGWTDYKNGFGSKSAEHWLGLEWVHYLTELDSRDITFRVDLMDFDMATAWEEYLNFNIASEAAHFQITFSTTVGDYTGTAGNSLEYHYGRYFQTYDHDPYGSTNWPSRYGGPWWYVSSHYCALNNPYFNWPNPIHGSMVWRAFRYDIALKAAEMKLRYTDFCNDSDSC